MANYHLAILKKHYLDAIVDGRKPIESRFTKTNRVPFGRIQAGDKIFLKQSSGPVRAIAIVKRIKQFSDLTVQRITKLKEKYNHEILGADEYWQIKADCKYGVLVWLRDIETIEPTWINKKDRRAWVLLTKKQNFGL